MAPCEVPIGIRYRGTVKWFNVTIGYGFIASDALGDIFVHANACPDGFVCTGEAVTFAVEPSDRMRGLQACTVEREADRSGIASVSVRVPTFVC